MERKFYRINLYNLYRFFLNEQFPKNEMCYGDFRLKDIIVQRKTLFRKEVILKLQYCLYCYEENETFYEFFSGRVVGTRRTPQQTSQYYKEPDDIERNGYILTSFRDFGTRDFTVIELTATSFATDIEPYIPYKSHMRTEMSRLLDAIDANYKRLTDMVKMRKAAAISAEEQSKSWLDSFIDGR